MSEKNSKNYKCKSIVIIGDFRLLQIT